MKYFIWFGYVLMLYVLIGFLNNEFIVFISVFSISVFLSVLFLHFRNWKVNSYFLLFSFPLFLMLSSSFIDGAWNKSYLSIVGYSLAVICGFIFCRLKSVLSKSLLFASFVALLFFMLLVVHPNVFYAKNYKSSFETDFNVPIKGANGEPIVFEQDTIYVLDFWTTSCSICIEKFPEFSELTREYEKQKIRFLAVNVPLDVRQNDLLLQRILKTKYSFDHAFLSNEADAAKIDVTEYPTILIIAKGKIVYNGYPAYESYVLSNAIRGVIDEQLE